MTNQEQPNRSEEDNDKNSVNDTDEQSDSVSATRWQRVKEHRFFRPALAIGGGVVVVGGAVLLALKSAEDQAATKTSLLDLLSEVVLETVDTTSEATTRKSPDFHTVAGYDRQQSFGPGRTETKTIHISSYPRGG